MIIENTVGIEPAYDGTVGGVNDPVIDADAELAGWGVWSVPNLITLGRLLCIPLFVFLLFGAEDRAAAAWLLAALGATDWVDGWVARRFGQVSKLGKILDPTTDRIMFLVAIVAMMIDDSIPIWFAIAVLAREIAISVVALILGALGARRIDVTWWGKTATFGLMFAFPLFLAGASTLSWADVAQTLAWIFAIPSLAISYYAAAEYIPIGLEALRDGRASRAQASTSS